MKPIGIDDIPEPEDQDTKEYVDETQASANNEQKEDSTTQVQNQDAEQQSNSTEEPLKDEDIDVTATLLKQKGIDDPSKIKFEDENGQIVDRDWNTLSNEEKVNILSQQDNTVSSDADNLDADEIQLINTLRQNNISPEEYANWLMQQGAQQYQQAQQPSYQVDDLSDDELYVLDLQSKVSDLSDEDAHKALEKAKEDPDLFTKQVNGLRNEYRSLESNKRNEQEQAIQQQRAQQQQAYQDSVLNSIQNLKSIGSLDLNMDDDDMNEIANFILSSDGAGNNYFQKALSNPDDLVKMAWFALKGNEAIDSITDYYNKEIQNVRRSSYEKGLKDGRAGKTTTSTVVFKPKSKRSAASNAVSINDLDNF